MNILRSLVFGCFVLSLAGCADTGGVNTSIKPRTEAGNPKIAELSALLKKNANVDILSKEDKQKTAELIHLILPTEEYIGADKEWKVNSPATK
jgi:hypothetical protein